MKTKSIIPFNRSLRPIAQQLPRLVAVIILLVLVALPTSAALASQSFLPDNHGIIKVYKFEDLNGDGVWQQPGEPPLANWTFDLYRSVSGQWVFQSSGVTDGTGLTSWINLAPSTYKVVEQTQPQYTNTTPLEQTAVSNNDTVTLNFGNKLRDMDFGDLPDNYNMTTFAQDGARHLPGQVYLGGAPDVEPDGLPTNTASGDDQTGVDDENGVQVVASPPSYWTQGTGTVQVTVTGGIGCLFAWADFWDSNTGQPGTDGDFTDINISPPWSEQIFTNVQLDAGVHQLTFPLPLDAAKYPIWARFRLAPAVDGSCSYYDTNPVTTHGFIDGGEVEDYYFSFKPTAISLASFTAQPAGVDHNLVGLVAILLAAAGVLLGKRMLEVRHQSKS